jgi:uncharacterized protein YjbI with pentapeptide repeats
MLDKFGVEGWNRWQEAASGNNFGHWSEGEAGAAVCIHFDMGGADLSGRCLDGLDFTLVWCKKTRFDGSSLVGARIGYCKYASFRGCDLRGAIIYGDITGIDFSDAKTDGIQFITLAYEPKHPPIGLSSDLLQLFNIEDHVGRCCKQKLNYRARHAVNITASLTTQIQP